MKNPKYAGSQSAPAAKNVPAIDFEKDHIRGNKDAKIAVIEYSDFECPFCHRVHPTYKQIMDKYGDNVMWVYRHFPLSFHQDAEPLAIGSECASELGGSDAFWAFADQIVIAEQ
jgi:protein-disulfide isomerase